MRCPVCGATGESDRSHCAICGRALRGNATRMWDRAPEAAAYEDLRTALEDGEALLGSTRGRLAGSWHERLFLSPQAVLSPYVNLGLTANRILVQVVNAGTGRANPNSVASVPLERVQSVTATDADPIEEGKTARLVVQIGDGALRMRAPGRHAAAARELAEVWRSLAPEAPTSPAASVCPGCEANLTDIYRFCPFCGKEQPQ